MASKPANVQQNTTKLNPPHIFVPTTFIKNFNFLKRRLMSKDQNKGCTKMDLLALGNSRNNMPTQTKGGKKTNKGKERKSAQTGEIN